MVLLEFYKSKLSINIQDRVVLSPILQVSMHVLGDQISIIQFTNYLYDCILFSTSLVFRRTPAHRVASHIGIPNFCLQTKGYNLYF